ncbi:MAG: hypothetical protein LQ342_000518 [Letrouitia transgressa]|nr:MAG: hypothetical protein LQ342_000518 [Letrouitia transgressa]
MFTRRIHHNDSFSKHRAGKATSSKQKRSFRDPTASVKRSERQGKKSEQNPAVSDSLTSPIVTICVGPEQRLFAAHESVLSRSPFFAAITRGQFLESASKRVVLPEESPEVFSSVLEYLYKGDYYPRLLHNKRKNAWELEDSEIDNEVNATMEATVDHALYQQTLLKDTILYCTAERYDLPELKRLALRKQGLRSGIHCATILASARYAYANTPDSDSKLRAHYLALIIRSRATFKRSGTMQMEMEKGGRLFFDLFVAVCNHMVSFEPLGFTFGKPGRKEGGEAVFFRVEESLQSRAVLGTNVRHIGGFSKRLKVPSYAKKISHLLSDPEATPEATHSPICCFAFRFIFFLLSSHHSIYIPSTDSDIG